MSYSIIYDLDYRDKKRQPIGVKFVNYCITPQTSQTKNNNLNIKQYITKQNSNERKNTNNTNNNSNNKYVPNKYKCDTKFNIQQQESFPSIQIFFEDTSQCKHVFGFLQNKLNQSDFRSIYKTIEILGEGSSGTVFNVINRNNLIQYAVKVVSKAQLLKEENSLEAIQQEIQLMKEITSDYIIKLHQVFEDSVNIYLVIDIFNGGTLQSRLEQKKNDFNIDDIQVIMKQIIQGIIDLHDKKIMHRDIKPDNILFKSNSSLQLVICDLGLATKWEMSKYLFQNVGTPGYVAPEVYISQNQYHGICDIYSCGVVLYQLLFNDLPFKGESVEQIIQKNKVSNIDYNQISIKNKVQQIGINLIKQMLEKDPELRITSEKCLKHQFFSLTKEDQNIIVQNYPQINRAEDIQQNVEEQNKVHKKYERKEILNKYNFIIPNTPILGKQPMQIANIQNLSLRDKSESLAIQNLQLSQSKNPLDSFLSIDNGFGSFDSSSKFKNNLQGSNQGSPKVNNLLRQTLIGNVRKDSTSRNSSPKTNPETLQFQKIGDLQNDYNFTNKSNDLDKRHKYKSTSDKIDLNDVNRPKYLTQYNNIQSSAKCEKISLFGQKSPLNNPSDKLNRKVNENSPNQSNQIRQNKKVDERLRYYL
ncbi:Protein kinase-like domain [Pseudocohnilembus persalinus]|uniref:Protein kinase-like domain n=1 Tax=Pseudocohnilembus persalinus TaxID=266149 RepID=A0A0V0QP42_PSEPJ|nr:Protein kinase-like domain [Pseudocohnilembus persalinus]|eukprot:KRX04147.1 Protein kinase-like domain [Pseudocohnilembus persalinus]